MNINGIRGPYGPIPTGGAAAPHPDTTRASRTGQPARAAGTAPAKLPGAPSGALPAQPPAGTDPELWSVLTADERTHFAKLGAMGPLTYGRILSGQLPATAPTIRGGRLDVKA